VFPEIENRLEESYRSTSGYIPLGRRLANWILEPERKKEELPRTVRRIADPLLEPWQGFLMDLRAFAGFSSRRWNDAELIRALMGLVSSKGRIIRTFRDLLGMDEEEMKVHFSGNSHVPVRIWDGKTLLVRKGDHRGRVALENPGHGTGTEESYDRILSLAGIPTTPLSDMTCTLRIPSIPSSWPSLAMLSEEGMSSFLILPSPAEPHRGEARLMVPAGSGESPDLWIERWNRQTLYPFLVPGSQRIRETRPLLALSPKDFSTPRQKTSNLSVAGHYSDLTDPSLLPILTEDWLADLSMVLPARKPLS
jgi:hypothetical protein